MEYPDAIEWLYGRQQAGIKLGLANIRRLLGELGLPEPGARVLHVAGTNGKGSTCALAESVLRAAGHRTGLFTSPHLVSFCERVRIDGEPVAEAEAAAGIAKLRALTGGWEEQPTFFEFATALALMVFARHAVDSIVLEVGLGGRLDSTNAVTPDVCAITPVAYDHRHILGDTLAQIAGEKAGIFKLGVPAVSSPQREEAREVLVEKSLEAGVAPPLQFVDAPWTASPVALPGEHQRWNAALAVAALRAGGFDRIGDAAIERGLAGARWRARFERFEGGRLVVDGAHNGAGAEALVEAWREVYGDRRPTVVFGAAANKELPELVAPLVGLAAGFVMTKADSPRSAEPAELVALLPEGVEAESAPEVAEALSRARATGRPVLVAGSLFLAGEAVALLDGERAAYEPSDQ